MMKNKTIVLDSSEVDIWFTSDNHFQHANIIKYCNRPFATKELMDATMIKNWNSVVKETDYVFVAGDFCFGGSKTWTWLLSHLNGIKYLTMGNHDKDSTNLWEKVDNIMNLRIIDPEIKDDQRITICHYPMLSWYQNHRGSWQLFGHVHGKKMPITPNQLDIGVDVHNFYPISYQQVKEIITKQNLNK